MLPRPRRLAAPLALASAFGLLLSAGSARAQLQVVVAPTATFTGSSFHYTYAVTNFTGDDIYVVNLNGLPLVPGALFNFSAPAGYSIQSPYDSGVGIESFSADTSFAPGTRASPTTCS